MTAVTCDRGAVLRLIDCDETDCTVHALHEQSTSERLLQDWVRCCSIAIGADDTQQTCVYRRRMFAVT